MRPFPLLPGLLAALLCSTAAEGAGRRMFVTSVAGSGNLSSWADAGGQSGLAAADAICQARATAAGLANPTMFRAWLSTSTTDAYCRIHGFGGRKANNCNQSTLPVGAGPWMRPGALFPLPFGEGVPGALAPTRRVYFPPRLDENGVTVHGRAWTASSSAGVLAGSTCANWTDGTPTATGDSGVTDATGDSWSRVVEFVAPAGCAETNHLYCFEITVGDPLPLLASWGRLAFVTASGGSGDLSSWPDAGGEVGLAAGDAICRARAAAAGLPNPQSFKAWLSAGALSARDRFDFDGPWMRLDRARVANSLADLTDGSLRTALNLTELGAYRGTGSAWTGTAATGLGTGIDCDGWTTASAGMTSTAGIADRADALWSAGDGPHCDGSHPLYCLQDLPMVFADGFESGTTAVWPMP